MRKGINWGFWGRHIAIAVAYGAAYAYLRHVSFRHWVPHIGLRLSCLLLLPYRYWLTLLVGEMVPMVYMNLLCLDTLGLAWVVAASVPSLGLMMPVVAGMRKRLPGLDGPVAQRMNNLLSCAVWISVILALNGLLDRSLERTISGVIPTPLVELAGEYFLGVFLGILTITPVSLVVARAIWHGGSLPDLARRFSHSRQVLESAVLLVVVSALVVVGKHLDEEIWRQVTLVVLFIPVIVFALRHGWEGAAITGSAANVGIIMIMLMPAKSDPSTLLAQFIIALAMITFLMLGARTSIMRQSLRRVSQGVQQARQELYANELVKRHSARELEQLYALLSMSHVRLLHRLQYFLDPSEATNHREELNDLRQQFHRLADSLSPREWQQIGGHPGALWSGPIIGVMGELGVRCEVSPGGQLSLAAPDVTMALYRLSCEAVAYLMDQSPTDLITLSTSSSGQGDQWRVEAVIESAGHPMERPIRGRLLSGLGVAGLSEAKMRGRAKLYAGGLRVESLASGGMRVSIQLSDRMDLDITDLEVAA